MRLSSMSIQRPVFATAMSLTIVLLEGLEQLR